MQVGFLVEILTGETQIDGGWHAVAVRIFIGQQATEGIAVPLPYYGAAAIGADPRRIEVIGMQIDQFRIHLRVFGPEIDADQITDSRF